MKNFFFIILTFFSLTSFAGGLSAWQEDTPYGHKIDHDGTAEGWVCLSLDTTAVCFKEFYFYKGYTIAHSDSKYYIINERKETIQKFNNQKAWSQAIKEQNLEPFFKREYNSGYSSAFGDGLFLMILLVPIPFSIPYAMARNYLLEKQLPKRYLTVVGLYTTIFLPLNPDKSGLGKKDFRCNPVYSNKAVLLLNCKGANQHSSYIRLFN